MGDYEHSQDVAAPAEALFAYLADVRNLPRYFSSMRSAEPADGEAVQVVARVHGEDREGEAWFHVDREQQQLSWGAEGPSNYHGRLEVSGDAHGSAVTVSLHTERVDSADVDQGLVDTLTNVKRLVEEGPAPGPTGPEA